MGLQYLDTLQLPYVVFFQHIGDYFIMENSSLTVCLACQDHYSILQNVNLLTIISQNHFGISSFRPAF